MYREGHVGAALLAYTPLGAVAVVFGAEGVALLGAVVAVALASLPDYDLRVSIISHRGITHTVWFAAAVGAVLGGFGFLLAGGGPLLGGQFGLSSTGQVAGFAAVVGVVTIGSHIAADAITPMGVTPFVPLSDRHYTASLVTADNTLANYGLLALGVAVAAGVAVLLFQSGGV